MYEVAESEEGRSSCVVSGYELSVCSPTSIGFEVSVYTSCGSEPDKNSYCSPDCHGLEEPKRLRDSVMSLASPSLRTVGRDYKTSRLNAVSDSL